MEFSPTDDLKNNEIYLHLGFELIGFDTCCYTNDDIGRREVRINLGFFFHREGRRRQEDNMTSSGKENPIFSDKLNLYMPEKENVKNLQVTFGGIEWE